VLVVALSRDDILAAAARLFAQRGFHNVGIDDIGAELSVSGPALYHHFRSKDAILTELLVGISQILVAEGRQRVEEATDSAEALASLIDWHTQFALANPDLITVQNRDLASLAPSEQTRVKGLQRGYVQLWATTIGKEFGCPPTDARAAAHAAFGLLNSTPHSSRIPARSLAALLKGMCQGALASLALAGHDCNTKG
jgi:AcrR family transcriptional regulator